MLTPILNLLRSCCRSNRKAQIELYDVFVQRFYATAFRITGCREDAEEVVHDAFMKIFDKLELQGMPISDTDSAAYAWMKATVVNAAIDCLRRRGPIAEELTANLAWDGTADDGASDDREDYSSLTVEAVREACSRLPDSSRIVLSLYLFEGYDHEEIAEILNVRPSTARVQYMRARKKLIELLPPEFQKRI